MLRGFENVIYWSHTRPDGEECLKVNSRMMGENIATGQTSPEQVMNVLDEFFWTCNNLAQLIKYW